MTDLINRADAIKAIDKQWLHGVNVPICKEMRTSIVQIISALPSFEAETKCIAQITVDAEEVVRRIKEEYDITDGWIPCSERLPSKDGRCLVTHPLFIRKNKWLDIMHFGKPSMPNTKVKGKCWYRSDDEWGDVVYDDILAWMPLPKPYREDGEE